MHHISYINDFLALVQNRSFSAAAKVQCITQPAFSRRIKILEESLGAELFNRDTHPVSLTSAGEIFLKHAQGLKESAASAYQDIQQHLSALDDPIRISTSHTLAIACLPQFLHHLAPKEAIPLKLGVKHIARCLTDLRQKQIDFALIHTHVDTPLYSQDEFNTICIGTDQLISVKTPNCETPENILAYAKETQLQNYIDATRNNHSKKNQNTIFESASGEVLKALCLAGHGTTVIPQSLVQKEIEAGELLLSTAHDVQIPLKIEFLRLTVKNRNTYEEKIWQNAKKQAIMV